MAINNIVGVMMDSERGKHSPEPERGCGQKTIYARVDDIEGWQEKAMRECTRTISRLKDEREVAKIVSSRLHVHMQETEEEQCRRDDDGTYNGTTRPAGQYLRRLRR